MLTQRRALLLAGLALPAGRDVWAQARAPSVQLGGVMGSKAMLVINGEPQMLAVGQTARGVRLLALHGDEAEVELGGGRFKLRVGGTPTAVGGGGRASGGREVVLVAGQGGHFFAPGAINGRAVNFMVDTGATSIAMSQADAQRIGLDLRSARQGLASTANGTVPVFAVTLNTVRLGDVEVANVQAVVMPAAMPYILLGNSFLGRFQMRRDNDVMRLELR